MALALALDFPRAFFLCVRALQWNGGEGIRFVMVMSMIEAANVRGRGAAGALILNFKTT